MIRHLRLPALLLTGILLQPGKSSAQWSLDPAINTPVCTALGKQIDLRMIEDGKGGTIIVWKDYRTASNIPDIYAQRLDSNGVAMWAPDGVPVCTNLYDQSTPAIEADGQGGCIISWSDWRSGIERDLYIQRLDSNGVAQWTADGAVLSNKVEREHNQRMVSDGAGGVIVFWEQQRTTDFTWDLWMQRINSSGQQAWTPGGIPVVVDGSNRRNPRCQSDGLGGAYVTWQDRRNGFEYDVYAQHVDGNGTRLWGTTGIAVCNASNNQNNPKIDPDPISGGVYVGWADQRNGNNSDIYAQRLNADGTPLWTANGIAICNAAFNQSALDMLSSDSVGGLIITWKDFRNGSYDIYAQKVNSAGAAQWAANGVPVCNAPNPQINPNIKPDGADGCIIVWQDSLNGNEDVRAQRLDFSGSPMWTVNGEWVCTAIGDGTSPKNVQDGGNGSIFAWQDKRTGTNDIYAHHLFGDGNPFLSRSNEIPFAQAVAAPNPFNEYVAISFDSPVAGEVTIVATDVTGKVTGSQRIVANSGYNETGLETSSFFPAAGVYLVKVQGERNSSTLRVVRTN